MVASHPGIQKLEDAVNGTKVRNSFNLGNPLELTLLERINTSSNGSIALKITRLPFLISKSSLNLNPSSPSPSPFFIRFQSLQMKIMSFNIRGLGSNTKHKILKKLIQREDLDLLMIQETKLSQI